MVRVIEILKSIREGSFSDRLHFVARTFYFRLQINPDQRNNDFFQPDEPDSWFDRMRDFVEDLRRDNEERNQDNNDSSDDSCGPGDRPDYLDPVNSNEPQNSGDNQPDNDSDAWDDVPDGDVFSLPDEGFTVDPSMISDDREANVLVDDVYVKNPTARNIEELLTNSDKIGGKTTNGKFMYVIDKQGNIIIGSRGGQKMPHPTLIGGKNPEALAAGMIDIRRGRIYSVDNNSGHFKPNDSSLKTAEQVFTNKLPKNTFGKDFKGFVSFDE